MISAVALHLEFGSCFGLSLRVDFVFLSCSLCKCVVFTVNEIWIDCMIVRFYICKITHIKMGPYGQIIEKKG